MVQTGDHMTVNILRKISVKGINVCPLHELQKTGCGSHREQETSVDCLGTPQGNEVGFSPEAAGTVCPAAWASEVKPCGFWEGEKATYSTLAGMATCKTMQ
ncbi:hypothetical protein MC885_004784 [Smutsia gigantea]|nr:hypothetical protein MC885_004784 [Smutsia gigantea]